MGSLRLETYWSSEMRSVLESYRQFETLIPASGRKGAAHPGEDGRYIESILRDMLKKFLPSGLEILNGFILRAGVESGFSGLARKKDEDRNSSQLDLIIYDIQNYPVYQRFGDTAVVLPEGVIGIISVKKTLRQGELSHEIRMLRHAAKLCSSSERKGPFLALVGMDDKMGKKPKTCAEKLFGVLKDIISSESPICYEEMPCFVGNLQSWTVHKVHNKGGKEAEYQLYVHREGEEHLGLQYLLKGILDVYYSENRNHGEQPGYIAFPSGKQYEGEVLRFHYDKISSERCRD